MIKNQVLTFQFFHKLRELVGDGDGQGSNEDGIEEEREEAAVGEIGLDIIIHELLDDVVPGKSRY